MKTLYIDINNNPVQNTDEIICVSDKGTLQNAFFYELGCSILSKSNINVPKVQLISGFNLPENADAYAKIVSQWENLKNILFGSDVEGEFNVHLPKEYMSWLGNHSNQDYRAVCRNNNYDCTQEHSITIDIAEFYNDWVDGGLKIERILRDNNDIEQVVFNDHAVTKQSHIIKSIREQFNVSFLPYEMWKERSVVVELSPIEEPLLKYPSDQWNNIYSEISHFEDGLAKVKAKEYAILGDLNNKFLKERPYGVNKYGFINENGEEIIPCVFDEIVETSVDRIYAIINNVEFVLNNKGEIMALSNDSNDRKIIYEEPITINGEKFCLFSKRLRNNKYGIKDMDGHLIVPCCFEHIEFVDSGHFLVYIGDCPNEGPYNCCYILNRNRKILNRLPISYEPFHFCEGLSVIQQNHPSERNNYNYIDIKGNIVIEGGWRQAGHFNNGIALVRKHGSSKQPYYEIDKTGKPINR